MNGTGFSRIGCWVASGWLFAVAPLDAQPDRRMMAEVDTIGGVLVVRNGAAGLWRESEEWQVVEAYHTVTVPPCSGHSTMFG